MIVKLLTEHHLEFLSLKGGCTGSSGSALVKMPHCWKPQILFVLFQSLVLLLSSNEIIVLHCSLLALICLAQSAQPRLIIGELNIVEQLLRIIQDYDNVSKK